MMKSIGCFGRVFNKNLFMLFYFVGIISCNNINNNRTTDINKTKSKNKISKYIYCYMLYDEVVNCKEYIYDDTSVNNGIDILNLFSKVNIINGDKLQEPVNTFRISDSIVMLDYRIGGDHYQVYKHRDLGVILIDLDQYIDGTIRLRNDSGIILPDLKHLQDILLIQQRSKDSADIMKRIINIKDR